MNETIRPDEGNMGFKCLTGSQIKFFGVILMVFDHIHQMFHVYDVPLWFTCIGRLVAPMFLFMCAEGFHYTRSRRKYMLLLLAGFEFMNVASLFLSRAMPNEDVTLMNNIFGTMLLCTVYMGLTDMLKSGVSEKKPGRTALSILLMLVPIAIGAVSMAIMNMPDFLANPNALMIMYMIQSVPNVMIVEGGPTLVATGLLFYIFREKRLIQVAVLVLAGVLTLFTFGPGEVQWMMVFAAIPMLMYNGKRGKGSKYFFYIFYPAHIYILYTIAYLIK
ncbi:MAG: conjugal transfer protein TraX [Clostridiales Family XIII bacterium]|nr:conjugal transfer protein TraX [Clostridiales Family XIII bacterium]